MSVVLAVDVAIALSWGSWIGLVLLVGAAYGIVALWAVAVVRLADPPRPRARRGADPAAGCAWRSLVVFLEPRRVGGLALVSALMLVASTLLLAPILTVSVSFVWLTIAGFVLPLVDGVEARAIARPSPRPGPRPARPSGSARPRRSPARGRDDDRAAGEEHQRDGAEVDERAGHRQRDRRQADRPERDQAHHPAAPVVGDPRLEPGDGLDVHEPDEHAHDRVDGQRDGSVGARPMPASPRPRSVVIARVIVPRRGRRGIDPAAMAPTTAPAPKARRAGRTPPNRRRSACRQGSRGRRSSVR